MSKQIKRLEFNATSKAEVQQYFQTRAKQLLSDGFIWSKQLKDEHGGYSTTYIKDGVVYGSYYCLDSFRGKGISEPIFRSLEPIITTENCHIANYLAHKGIKHHIAGDFLETKEYQLISEFYGNQKAKRSQCFLMNHIDESLFLLNYFHASENAKKAFCIHPMLQADDDLKNNWNNLKDTLSNEVLGLALEYRNIANAYLSGRYIESVDEIKLSPLTEVNNMLKADKVQNYKDFIIYHQITHLKNKELDQYFRNWLSRLNITINEFDYLFQWLRSIEIEV
jgi:hypothetical protein